MVDATASAILNAGRAIPYELSVAYDKFVAALDEAIDRNRQSSRFSSSKDVIDAIERFVYELKLNQLWFDELKRRAVFVEENWREDSAYSIARRAALKSYRATPKHLFRGQFGLECVRSQMACRPIALDDVIDVKENIEHLLSDSMLTLRPHARSAFDTWARVCTQLQRDGERLAVDGCYYMYHVFHATEFGSEDWSEWVRAIFSSDIGAVHYESVLEAGHSIIAWIKCQEGVANEGLVGISSESKACTPVEEVDPDVSQTLESDCHYVLRRTSKSAGEASCGHVQLRPIKWSANINAIWEILRRPGVALNPMDLLGRARLETGLPDDGPLEACRHGQTIDQERVFDDDGERRIEAEMRTLTFRIRKSEECGDTETANKERMALQELADRVRADRDRRGRARKVIKSPRDRAAATVTKNRARAMQEFDEAGLSEFASHIAKYVTVGNVCRYDAPTGIQWGFADDSCPNN